MSDSFGMGDVSVVFTPKLLRSISSTARIKSQKYTAQNIFNMMREQAEKGHMHIQVMLKDISDDTIIHLEQLGFKHEIAPVNVDEFVIDDAVVISWGE